MNKTAIKNFAIWSRNKLIADISYKAGLLGITEKGIKSTLPQSTQTVQFFDIGTKEPSSITGIEIQQRKKLVEEIEKKAKQSDYATAYKNVIEEVAYTWFNRLIAIRFMEVNDYLPTRIRVLSSESNGKAEPDLVTHALEANLDYTAYEKDRIIQLKHENKLDELFRMLFIKQCNALNANLPELFEKTSDYTELLLNVSFTDKEGIVYHLVNDIDEDDFNVSKEGQVEIIGWLYQYYNTEQNELVYDGSYAKNKISKDLLPAATTIYTPDWAVRYMVENSLGKLWIENHPNSEIRNNLKYFIHESVNTQSPLANIQDQNKTVKPEDIKIIDPCMGSGHILVYVFDVLILIYESMGYSQREAAKSILINNIFGLDIDDRAFQLSYFALMMKARQYNRRILNESIKCNLYSVQESNSINRAQLDFFGNGLSFDDKNIAIKQITSLLNTFENAKEYGSILKVDIYDWDLLNSFISSTKENGQMSLESIGLENTKLQLQLIVDIARTMAQEFEVVITNPPYLGSSRFSPKLDKYVKENYLDEKSDLSMVMLKRAMQGYSKKNGFISFITTSSWMFLSSFEKTRNYMLENFSIDSLVDFGTELFDGKVGHNPIVSWVNRNVNSSKNVIAIRLVDYCYSRRDEKEPEFFNLKNRYTTIKDNFLLIPGKPIAYWASNKFISAYERGISIEKISDYTGSQNKTANNEQYLRKLWEVSSEKVGIDKKWVFYAKGGEYRKHFGNLNLVVDWSDAARDFYKSNPTSNLLAEKYWFKEGITYTMLTSKGPNFRYLPDYCVFDMGGPAICYLGDKILYVLAFLNSCIAEKHLAILNPTLNLQAKDIKNLPLIIDQEYFDQITAIERENVALSEIDWNSIETSKDFIRSPLIKGTSIESAFSVWEQASLKRFSKIKANEEEINRVFINIYGLENEIDPTVRERDVTLNKANLLQDIKEFISYAVGCIFGRYSLDYEGLVYAGGKWDLAKYCKFIPDNDNILPISDEEYLTDDIVVRFVDFVRTVYGQESLESNLNFIASALGGKDNSSRDVIRGYFLKDFFKDHCQLYQKRPIYWLFDSGKQNGFKAIIYMHRYDENTIGNLRIDYLHRIQRIYENEITRMQDTIENSRDAREVTAATKRKEKLIKQLQETKEYDEKIAHLALARTSIDLDDGVKVNYEKIQTDRDGKKLDVLSKI